MPFFWMYTPVADLTSDLAKVSPLRSAFRLTLPPLDRLVPHLQYQPHQPYGLLQVEHQQCVSVRQGLGGGEKSYQEDQA